MYLLGVLGDLQLQLYIITFFSFFKKLSYLRPERLFFTGQYYIYLRGEMLPKLKCPPKFNVLRYDVHMKRFRYSHLPT